MKELVIRLTGIQTKYQALEVFTNQDNKTIDIDLSIKFDQMVT